MSVFGLDRDGFPARISPKNRLPLSSVSALVENGLTIFPSSKLRSKSLDRSAVTAKRFFITFRRLDNATRIFFIGPLTGSFRCPMQQTPCHLLADGA